MRKYVASALFMALWVSMLIGCVDSLKNQVEIINKQCPIDLGILGEVTHVDLDDRTIVYHVSTNPSVLNIWYVLYTVKSNGTRGSWFAEISSSKAHTPNDCNYEITVDTEGADRWVLLKAYNAASSSYNVDHDELQNHVTILNRKNIYDVVLLMGQSNAAGRGATSTAQPEDAPALIRGAGIEFRAISDASKFYAIAEPFGAAENNGSGIDDGNMKTGSMMTSFTNEYFTRTGFPVIGISASKGGTTISQWQPNGALLTDAIARLTACKTFAANHGYTLRHIYMIWCQGESEHR